MNMPDLIAPMLCTSAQRPPTGEAVWHQSKYDGYRLLIRRDGPDVRLYTRGGHDWTRRFPVIAQDVLDLRADGFWLDGELVHIDSENMADFEGLQTAIAKKDQTRLYFQAFDLLYLGHQSLMRRPLHARDALLAETLEPAGARIRYSPHFVGNGPRLLEHASALGHEGIVSKRPNSLYHPEQRSRDWHKVKCWQIYEVPLLGLQLDTGKERIKSLLIGTPDLDQLAYGGRVEFGLNQLGRLRDALIAAATAPSPFAEQRPDPRRVWLPAPVLIHVKSLPWRPGRKLRHMTLIAKSNTDND